MKTLHIIVADKVASYRQRDGYIVCGNSDYQVEFTFSPEWDAYERKIARFIWRGKPVDVEFSGTVCPVPIVANTEQLEVGVYVEKLSTTTSAVIPCRLSVLCNSKTEAEGTVVIPEGAPVLVEKTFNANGEYPATNYGADGFSKVKINVPSEIPDGYIKPTGTIDITGKDNNKTVDVTQFANAKVNIPTGSGEITLQEKTATENGEVTADEGYDGLSKVIVNVQSEEAELNDIHIDHNGDYEATAFGWDGFSFVSVNVPSVNDTYIGEVTIEDDTAGSGDSEEPMLITFTIDGVSYQAKDGTKWYEWVHSDYNTGNFTCATENAAVYNSDSTKYIVTTDSTTVNGSVTIKAMAYTLMEEEKEIDINGTWVLNETLTPDFIEEGTKNVRIRFTTPAYPDVTFSDILRQDREGEGSELWYMAAKSQEVYKYGVGWLNNDARTITITDSKNATDAFKAALIANGTNQE
jgi:hypothetical protein